MSIAQQAIRARKKARVDPRYPSNKKDVAARDQKYRARIEAAKLRAQRKKG